MDWGPMYSLSAALQAERGRSAFVSVVSRVVSTVGLLALLSACGGGSGGGSNSSAPTPPPSQPPTPDPVGCFDDFDASDSSFDSLAGGLLYTRNSRDELIYHNLETQQETVLVTGEIVIYVPSASGKYVSVMQQPSAPAARLFLLPAGQELNYGAPSPAFWLYDDQHFLTSDNNNLYLVETTSGHQKILGPTLAGRSWIEWSKDSSLISISHPMRQRIFSVDGSLVFDAEISSASSDSFAAAESTFSPDSLHFAYARREGSDEAVYVVNIASAQATRVHLMGDFSSEEGLKGFSWSPSSRYLLIRSTDSVPGSGGATQTTFYLHDVQLGSKTDITGTVGEDVAQISWAFESDTLVFLAHKDGAGKARVFALDAATPTFYRELSPTASENLTVERFYHSPTHPYVAYAATGNGESSLYVADTGLVCFEKVNGGLLAGEAIDSRIDWSWSGQWLAYYPGDAEYRVLAVKADGSSPVDLTSLVTPNDPSAPTYMRWLGTSNAVFFAEPATPSSSTDDAIQLIQLSTLQTQTFVTDGTTFGNTELPGIFLPVRR